MSNEIKICLAGIPMAVHSESGFMADFCRDYITDESPLFSVSTTKEAVTAEVENAPEPTTYHYAEALCLYREMAERLPLYDRAVFHGAAIEYGGKAYLFTAPSGTGKTTTIKAMLNLVHPDNGEIVFFGKPLAGNEAKIKNRIGYSTGSIHWYPKKRIRDLVAVVRSSFPKARGTNSV